MLKLEYLKRANIVHNNEFKYHLSNNIDLTSKIIIECSKHGIFKQQAKNHLYLKHKCPECSKYKKVSKVKYLDKLNHIHNNKYDYTKVKYSSTTDEVIIICPDHGEFKQKLYQHLKYGCQKCSYIKNGQNRQISIDEFLERVKGDYDYSNTTLEYPKVLNICCKIHGDFNQNIFDHLSGAGCPKCSVSKGELYIRTILTSHNIRFEEQMRFKNCINPITNRTLPFDFYLHDYDICIEYDGIQHFEPVEYFGGEKTFKKQQINDLIKDQYCDDNNIKLIRINYKELK